MALVKYGGGIVGMSGSIAGNTHSHNRYGDYVRARKVPTNPNTAGQQRSRNAIGALAAYWFSTISAAQRAAWAVYAENVAMVNRLGEVIHLSGFNHFIRSNSILSQQGQTLIAAAPVDFSLPPRDPLLAITASEATQLITLAFTDGAGWCFIDDGFMQVLSGKPQQGSRNFFNGPWSFADLLLGDTAAPLTSPQTLTPADVISEGQAIWVQCRILLPDGRVSEPMNVGPTLVAA